jgi:7-cyano-7-deazaguanine synthase
MDSTTLAYHLRPKCDDLVCLSFDYGQRHKKELDYARDTADRLAARFHLVDLSSVTPLLGGSALTDDIAVPEGHYASETMRQTVVPNRNMMMASIAIALAVSEKAECVAMGMHAGDHPIYPDCRPDFVFSLRNTAQLATEGFSVPNFTFEAPFVYDTKAEIVMRGNDLGVPWTLTWSCYQGGELHCGRCGTCVERQEAFAIAGIGDPTEYE